MRPFHFAAPLTIAALVLAGCGGSDDEAPTKAEYVASANKICKSEGQASEKAASEAIAALGAEEPTPEQLQVVAAETIIPSLEKQLVALKALDQPKDGGEEIDAIYASLTTAIEAGKADPSSLTDGSDSFADANEKALAYGLTDCGSE